MSLRLRLTLIIAALLLLSTSIGASYIVFSAKSKVQNEIESVATLTSELLELIVNRLQTRADVDKSTVLLAEIGNLQNVRHLQIKAGDKVNVGSHAAATQKAALEAPEWFVQLVKPEQETLVFSIYQSSTNQIQVFTDSSDEIGEVWEETKTSMLMAFSTAALFAITLYFFLGRWLKPVQVIAAGLDAVEHGDYSQRIPDVALPELKLIANQFNHLGEVLSQSKTENDRLKQRTLEIQELERRHLAQELHDEMGQTISAIKAIAATGALNQKADNNHAQTIEQLADRMYASVRDMIGRLRPAVLDELGLIAALQQMTDDWNEHHGDTFCSLKFSGLTDQQPPALDETQQIHVYRIVQEALTNVAKHSQADFVKIVIQLDQEPHRCELTIEDNGCGFDTMTTHKGMGLNGIEERTNALRGTLNIRSDLKQGVSIHVTFPLNT